MIGIVDVPRSGLMQFELTHPGFRSRAMEKFGLPYVWVKQPEADDRGVAPCGVRHQLVWPVAIETFPTEERQRELAIIVANGGSYPVVCTCAGRVIE